VTGLKSGIALQKCALEGKVNGVAKYVLGCMLALVVAVTLSPVHSFDIFWQLASGRYIVDSGAWLYHDPFTLAGPVGRFEHCWLHDLVVLGFYSVGGNAALSFFKALLLSLAALMLILTARARKSSFSAILFVFPFLFYLTQRGWLERPQLWTFAALTLYLLVLERFRQTPSRSIYWLIPLQLLWLNLHAGAILAYAILLAYGVGLAGDSLLKRVHPGGVAWRSFGLTCAALALCLFATPYGWKPLKTLFGAPSLGVSASGEGLFGHVYNMDWAATTWHEQPYFYVIVILVLFMLLVHWRRVSLVDVCLLGGLALMGLKLNRHTPLFYFAAIAIVPRYLDASADWIREKLLRATFKRFALGFLVVLLLQTGAAGWVVVTKYPIFKPGLREGHYPIAAAEFIQAEELSPQLFNAYEWGGYLIWKLYPDYQVFWDGRQTSTRMFSAGMSVLSAKPEWQELLDRYEVNTLVLDPCTMDNGQQYPLLGRLRTSEAWALVFAEGNTLVFVRNSSMPRDWVTAHRLPASRIDDTVMSKTAQLIDENPKRFMAYWERALIYYRRGDFPRALDAVRRNLATAPVVHPNALSLERMLSSLVGEQ